MRLSVGIALLLAASGCRVFAGKSDYEDYRAVRLARDSDQRLYAMQRYTERHPDGAWEPEISIERNEREAATFETGKSTRDGLERYLKAYPEGAYAAQARSRLAAVDVLEKRKRAEQEQAKQLAAARKQREQELSRTWVTRFAGYWAGTLLRLTDWGSPIPEVARQNQQFSRAFGAAPRPRCTADECVKYYQSPYGVPVPGGTRVERTLSLVLRLRMIEGKLDRAELLLPAHGFSRWYELEQRKVIASGDAEGRTQAVQWALARLQDAIKPIAPGLSPLSSYTLAPIPAPAIASSGELTDTSAEDPSEPSKQLTGVEPSAAGPDIGALVKPKEAEPAADMVLAPMGVTKEGRSFTPGTAPASQAPAAEGGGEVMVMDTLAVPKEGGAQVAPAANGGSVAAPAAADVAAVPAVVQAFSSSGLRVVLFAAAGAATGSEAYDGLLIERASAPTTTPAAKPTKAKRPAPAAPPPQQP
ncbi:MAG TPA: hypothetical protein VJV78_46945 [Polyangiales bacterium]|nr:hypothetical protein [Polyangiales bacterium]